MLTDSDQLQAIVDDVRPAAAAFALAAATAPAVAAVDAEYPRLIADSACSPASLACAAHPAKMSSA